LTWFVFYICYETGGWLIRLAMLGVVLRRQLAPGASLAWLGIVFLHPYIGLTLYLLVGESRLGPRRSAQHRDIIARFRDPARRSERDPKLMHDYGPDYQPMVLQAEKISGLPVLAGNAIQFFPDADKFFEGLLADIESAKSHVHLLYYMFACDSIAQRVADALIAATKRGVKCRLLADGLASRPFFRHGGLAPKLTAAGVEVAAALPVTPIRRRFARMDLRNHRKLAIIDDRCAWAGSHNLINPDYGGRRCNPWVDVTARFTGPVVSELALVFAEDWAFETGTEVPVPSPQSLAVEASASAGSAAVCDVPAQTVPTGPTTPGLNYRRLLLAAIQCSRQKIIITTPYFVPDEATLTSLMMAADRGVDVNLIFPEKADHLFTAAAGRAHYQSLLDAGVKIHLFRPSLLHAKTATIDDAFALFGSANLDVRSFELNFELSNLLYGQTVTQRLREIQNVYLGQSTLLTTEMWSGRPVAKRYADRAISLLSPLL
jgi:cardiolipin synthase